MNHDPCWRISRTCEQYCANSLAVARIRQGSLSQFRKRWVFGCCPRTVSTFCSLRELPLSILDAFFLALRERYGAAVPSGNKARVERRRSLVHHFYRQFEVLSSALGGSPQMRRTSCMVLSVSCADRLADGFSASRAFSRPGSCSRDGCHRVFLPNRRVWSL